MFLIVKSLTAFQLLFCTVFKDPGYHSPLEKYSDQWNNEYFSQANTAADAGYLNGNEIAAIHVLNLARLSPRLFAATVIEPLTRNGYSPEFSSLVNTMNAISTLKIIYPLEEVYQSAKSQALLEATTREAAIGKNISSLKNNPDPVNGCLYFGNNNDPVQLIINLLLDLNDDSKRSRSMCLGDFKYIGISMQPLKKEGYFAVIRFGNTMEEKNSTEDNGNKTYPTCWGGDITFSGVNSANVYTAHGLGQEIYKDDETRRLEKSVTPWLLFYTNLYRKEHGLDTLQYSQCLIKAASFQTEYLFNESRKKHQFKLNHFQDSGSQWFKGRSPSDRALAAGCEKSCGENALYSSLRPVSAYELNNRQKLNNAAQQIARDMIYNLWHNSKGHRENMLTVGYSSLGVSVAIAKHYPADAYTDEKGEKKFISEKSAVGWIVFGIQVMAY